MHPAVGPVAEAEDLYVKQLKLRDRIEKHSGECVIWDIGLGAAANALAVLRATQNLDCEIRLISFDNTTEPLQFALTHAEQLGYLSSYENHLRKLLQDSQITFTEGKQKVTWQFHLTDFPAFLAPPSPVDRLPSPHAILFDAFSPAKNPEMWTQPLFANLFRILDPHCPCSMATYSRSTMFRVALLLAGFFVGIGHATGKKEETTIAANTLDLIQEPLARKWLDRIRQSSSAEPLWEPVYRQAPLSTQTWEQLQQHPQFR